MTLIEKLKRIEGFVCRDFERLGLDDPVEEGIWEQYAALSGADCRQIRAFEQTFGLTLPDDVKELYAYKDGSGWFCLLPAILGERRLNFEIMPLEAVCQSKATFQNRNAPLTDFPDYFTPADITRLADKRIRPYLFHERWFPFAVYADSCFLMLDFAPAAQGKTGQILCYIHDPDEVVYAAESLTDLVDGLSAHYGITA